MSGLNLAKELRGRHDFDAEGFFQNEQVPVAGDQVAGAGSKRSSQDRMVSRITAAASAQWRRLYPQRFGLEPAECPCGIDARESFAKALGNSGVLVEQ